ncbi:hypothetical protein ACFQPF_05325 [Fictibacillus iocasae]|uniref:Uncharacterized protein n=1 Tax=Fictibacillus iocasae TaxID=2715437 RepID=A0ABW2NN86_9BACL
MLNKWKNALLTKEVTIPVSNEMLSFIKPKVEGISNAKVSIDQVLILTGTYTVEKLFIKKDISFQIRLKPKSSEGRMVLFDIDSIKPFNLDIINDYVMNNKYMTYSKNVLSVDLNAIDAVRKVPVGQIRDVQIVNDRLMITMGI